MDTTSLDNLLKNNTVSKDDFTKGFKAVQNGNSYGSESIFTSATSNRDIEKYFNELDVNNDGKIDSKDKLKKELEKTMSEDDLNLLVEELTNLFNDSAAESASAAGGTSGGGYGGGGSYGSTDSDSSQTSSTESSYSNMSVEELETKLSEAKSNLSTKQDEMSKVMDGSDSDLAQMQTDIDTKEKEYQELLEQKQPELAAEYEQARTDLDTHNQAIAETQANIFTLESKVASLDAEISALDSTISSCDSTLKELNAMVGKKDAPADLSSRISAVETKKNEAEAQKTLKESERNAANSELTTAKTTLSDLEAQTAAKEQALEAVQQKIDNLNDTELTTAKTAVDELRAAYETKKSEKTSSIQEEINTAQTEVNTIQAELSAKQKNEIESKASALDAQKLYDSMGLKDQGLSYEKFSFMLEGYNNINDKRNGRVAVVDEVNHNCYVFDMNTKKLVGKYRVSTGENSSSDIDVANTSGKHGTPGGWLAVNGVHYGEKYGGNAMNLEGLEKCNNNTASRSVIAHPISYSIGYSTHGCLGFRESESTIKNKIMQDGTLVFVIKDGMTNSNSKYRQKSSYYQV